MIEVDTSINGRRVAAVRHGPEFEGQVLDTWAYEHRLRLNFIRPCKPVESAYIQSFNGRFRDECLNEHWFLAVAHARQVIEGSRNEYNTEGSHGSFRDLTPEQFARHGRDGPMINRSCGIRRFKEGARGRAG